jgi:dTDP-4-amino-4,6-dideoxygalactose transaminase
MAIAFFGIARTLAEEKQKILELTERVLGRDTQLQGPENLELEKECAKRLNRKFAVTVGSGTDALIFSLRALSIGPGDEVLVTALSFVASASCLLHVGAKPVFVDVDPQTLLMDFSDVKKKVSAKTKAIIAVHLFGQMLPASAMDELVELGIPVIEDAAQALGASNRWGVAGSFGRVSCFSFDPTKILGSMGSGGMVLTDDPEIEKAVRKLKFHGRSGDRYVQVGCNSQLPELFAAFLRHRLTLLSDIVERRRQIATWYVEFLSQVPQVQFLAESEAEQNTWQKMIILVPAREQLIRFLALEGGIECKAQYPRSLPEELLFQSLEQVDHCPVAVSVSQRSLGLPIYPGLTMEEVRGICLKIQLFFRQMPRKEFKN